VYVDDTTAAVGSELLESLPIHLGHEALAVKVHPRSIGERDDRAGARAPELEHVVPEVAFTTEHPRRTDGPLEDEDLRRAGLGLAVNQRRQDSDSHRTRQQRPAAYSHR
jgi:hypothetical protein